MLFRQRRNTFFRIFDNFGYIINRLFTADKVLDASGGVFLQALSRKGQSLETLTAKIAKSFQNVDINTLNSDVIDFLTMLENDGFIVSGETEAELEAKDICFSYSRHAGDHYKTAENRAGFAQQEIPETQKFLIEQCKTNPRLIQLHVDITTRCNERCVHCYIPHNDKTIDIDTVVFYNILSQCREMGVLNFNISGGEPFLHPNFPDFLRKTQDYDLSVTVLTNLTVLNDEIIAVLKEAPINSVHVSLYSMDSTIHDSITTLQGSFDKTYKNILKLIEQDIPLDISCPLMKQNKDTFWDVVQWGKKNGVYVLVDPTILARYDNSIDNLDNRLNLEEINKLFSDYILNDVDYQQLMLSRNVEKENTLDCDSIVCSACIMGLCINAKGNVYPCTGWNYGLGNLNEMSLREIWESSSKAKYLRDLRMKDFPKCLNCPDIYFCNVCMARNANESPKGDIFNINDYHCQVAALNREIVTTWKRKDAAR